MEPPETYATTAYLPYIVSATSGTVFLSARLCLFVDAACLAEVTPAALAPPLVAAFLLRLEALLRRLDAAVGRAPPVTHAHRGRQCVEVAHLGGAAGLAHHGRAGCAVGPAFLRESLAGGFLHHAFCYELTRNYIFPETFTPLFKLSCLEGDECWGWLNQGFVNILGCLLCVEGGLAFNYFGHTAQGFRAGMEAHLLVYLARRHGLQGAPCAWEDVFLHERLPWAPSQSLDNLYSGVLSVLFQCHGGQRFFEGFFAALPHLAARLPQGLRDVRTTSDNFFLACSAGAQASLAPFFEGLGFPVSEEAKGLVGAVVAAVRRE